MEYEISSAVLALSWLRLLDVAWQALDAHARLTLNDLVRMSLAGQPLPERLLKLETLKDDTGASQTSLSGMPAAGWSPFDRHSTEDEGGLIATLTEREEDGDAAPLQTRSTTTTRNPTNGHCGGPLLPAIFRRFTPVNLRRRLRAAPDPQP